MDACLHGCMSAIRDPGAVVAQIAILIVLLLLLYRFCFFCFCIFLLLLFLFLLFLSSVIVSVSSVSVSFLCHSSVCRFHAGVHAILKDRVASPTGLSRRRTAVRQAFSRE